MQSLTLISVAELGDTGVALDCDLDGQSRLCVLLETHGGGRAVRFGSNRWPVPDEWAPYVRQVRWLGENKVVLWPVAKPPSPSPYIGTISASGTSTISSAYPLDIFAHNGFLVCTFPEEQIKVNADINLQSDLISIFSSENGRKIGRFLEPFLEKFSHEYFFEVTHGVLDGRAHNFWFTAYNTKCVWCLSFGDTITVSAVELETPAEDVLTMCCDGENVTLIFRAPGHLISKVYRKTKGDLTLYSKSAISLMGNIDMWFNEPSDGVDRSIRGLNGNLITVHTAGRVALFALNAPASS